MDFVVILSLFFTVLLGGGLVLVIPKPERYLKLLLSFSGAYLLAICVLHLIPEVYAVEYDQIGIFILAGFMAQLFLEYFSQGIEHGHIHAHDHGHSAKNFPVTIMLSLCLHSFFEGMPLGGEVHGHAHLHAHVHAHAHDISHNNFLYGVLLHKFPVAIALMTMLIQSGLSKLRSFIWLIVFALMAPAGVLVSNWATPTLLQEFDYFSGAILAVVVGMFLHISTTILFESTEGHKFNLMKLATVILGGVVAFLTL